MTNRNISDESRVLTHSSLAEIRQRTLMDKGDGVAWLRAFVAHNNLSRAERIGPAMQRRPSDANSEMSINPR